jgi:hypothetical protein
MKHKTLNITSKIATVFYAIMIATNVSPAQPSSQGQLPLPSLQYKYNVPRNGDGIIKQQVEYKDAGRDGQNVIWDFGILEPINEEYVLNYEYYEYDDIKISDSSRQYDISDTVNTDTNTADMLYADTSNRHNTLNKQNILVGTEHYTMYYYKITDSTLETVGYENPVNKVEYSMPLLKDIYPLNYGDSCEQDYELQGVYSQRTQFSSKGKISITADAYGMIILPSGDTIKHVLRVKTIQSIIDTVSDTVKTSNVENYRWFASGLRYPVFEVIKLSNADSDDEESIFETAFFFPPPQDEFFATPDTANQNLQAELQRQDSMRQQQQQPLNPWEGMYYNLSPNPVSDHVLFEIYLPRPVNNLHVQISSQSGISYLRQNKGAFTQGLNAIRLPLGNWPFGYYALDFWLDGYIVTGSLILKTK